MARVYNFNPGPCTLPLSALEKCQAEFLDFHGTGMSIVEASHRSKDYEAVHNDAQKLLRTLMNIPDDYQIIFLGGGASLQFCMVPMNFIPAGRSADYVITGAWAKKAYKEAALVAKAHIAASSEADHYTYIPKAESYDRDPQAAYLHVTSNNTIYGTEWQSYPDFGTTPVVVDMSSDILSRRVDVSKFSLIYAGAQKNLGPAGVTVVIIKDNFAKQANNGLPTMLSYRTHIDNNSLFNTPPVFAIYLMKLVLEWVDAQGGLKAIESLNRKKAELLYSAIDSSEGYYRGTAKPDSRSWMNATLRLPDEEREQKFIAEAKGQGLVGLKGHRDVGGIRVSMYNAMPLSGIEKLVQFMAEFKRKN
ncbi:MAG TPA: 3-phosphoserine/phosphohydroxythreonine transaminase [bacterium]|nr:3-phosphoserine/phosphohydroxythreonine transaminase [bacterium]HNT66447.1 3-phosphoserine/phosphohydroxythreonine transaminase [bacterium]